MKLSNTSLATMILAAASPATAFMPAAPRHALISSKIISAAKSTVVAPESIDLLQEADAIFDSIDTNQDGSISNTELVTHLVDTMGYSAESPQCRYLFEAFDGDNSGEISRQELKNAFGSHMYMTFGLGGGSLTAAESYTDRMATTTTGSDNTVLMLDDLADMVFDLIDTDESGVIDPQELKEHFVKVTAETGTESQAKEYVETIFSVLDSNLDGAVSRQEMRDAFKQFDFRFLYNTLGLPVYKKKSTV